MATPPTPRPGRTLFSLALIILVLAGALLAGIWFSTATPAPNLALDLEGGTQIILTPRTTDGSTVTTDDINQAISIIRQRVDASGVSEAEITSQGQQNIVVALPGQPTQETLDLVRQSAQMRFRPVLLVRNPGPLSQEALDAFNAQQATGDTTITPAPADAPPSADEIAATSFAAADANGDGVLTTDPTAPPTSSSDPAWVTEQLAYDFYSLDCTDPANLTGGDHYASDVPVVACSTDGSQKYILGPTDVEGTSIAAASAGMETNQLGQATGSWIVQLSFDDEGSSQFAESTGRLSALTPPQNQFAIVLDGLVVSAPSVNEQIPTGHAMISGDGFTRESTTALANQLQFGSLPINFEVQSEQQISATLGIEQLERGILAGAIGLALVVVYMLIQYHALGFVALASLVVAGLISYLAIALLSWTTGYRLSLAGVAGLIVAIGITADSFIVYFERIRDEVREGRGLRDAVDYGWIRARRTILASDGVNFLAAFVLYFLAVGGVRGFAFTLGLTTIVDLIVVMLFTHPMMQFLIRTRFFGEGHRFSGLNPEKLGSTVATYRGRGSFRSTSAPSKKSRKAARADVEASQPRESIAERKAREAAEKEETNA